MGAVTSSTWYRPSQNKPSLTESYATAKQKKRDLSNPQLCLLKENWIWLVSHHMEPIKDIKTFAENISKGCWQLCWVARLESVICASPESSSWTRLLNIFHWTDHSLTDLFTQPKINKLSNCSAHMDFYAREGYFAAKILFLPNFPIVIITVNNVNIIYIKAMQRACVKKKSWFLTNFPFCQKVKTPEVSQIKGGLGQTKWSSAAMAESNILRPSLNSQPTFQPLSIWPRHNFLWTVAREICEGADTKNTRSFIYVYLKINQFKQIRRSTDCL